MTIHNPFNVTPNELNTKDGWRFLAVGELETTVPMDSEYFSLSSRTWLPDCHRGEPRMPSHDRHLTYRTKTPIPAAFVSNDPLDEIAKLVGVSS